MTSHPPRRRCLLVCICACLLLSLPGSTQASATDYPFRGQGPFPAKDTLQVGEEPNPDARACLQNLAWEPAEFPVHLQAPKGAGDLLVRFPSPRPNGEPRNDLVAMEWYIARSPSGQLIAATPVIVVHEIGRNMAAGRAIAVALSRLGLHAFLVQLPTYGNRSGPQRPRPAELLQPMRQAIADVRRARDAVTMLPTVQPSHIALQGTSLGGIIAATAGSLDAGFDSVHLLLAGGDLFDVIKHGQRDTAKVRRDLQRAGVTDRQLKAMTRAIEPTRVAHRLRPRTTWLYSGTQDTVIPLKNAVRLATAAKLPADHHRKMNADHYSGVIYLPWVVTDIAAHIQSER